MNNDRNDLVNDPGGSGGGIPLALTLTILFVFLKLSGLIRWHWGWVLSPLWISMFLQVFLAALFYTALALDENRREKDRK